MLQMNHDSMSLASVTYEWARIFVCFVLSKPFDGPFDGPSTGTRHICGFILEGQSCRSALNLGGASAVATLWRDKAAPPYRRHEEFCPARSLNGRISGGLIAKWQRLIIVGWPP